MGRRRFYARDVVILCIIITILAFTSGVFYGAQKAVNMCVDLGFKILEKKNISIDLDKTLIQNEITRYKNNIGGQGGSLENMARLR